LTTLLDAVTQSSGGLAVLLGFVKAHYILVAVALLILVLYFAIFRDTATAPPPTFNFIPGLIQGKFNMKETGALGLIMAGFKAKGDCYRIRLGHRHVTMMLGPEASQVAYEARDTELNQAEVYTFTVPVFGKGVVYDSPARQIVQQFKFVSKGLSGDAMRSHSAKILQETEMFFKSWPAEGTICLKKALSELTCLTASRCLLGREIRESVHVRFAELYEHLNDGMTAISFVWPSAPTKAHRLRDKARVEISRIFKPIIAARRASNNVEGDDDFLQVLIDSRYRDGTALTDEEIIGLLLAALFAGQHTSSITSTWTGLNIFSKKADLVPKLLAEQKSVMERHSNEINMDSLADMELLHNCMKETLRLYPPLILLMRKVKVDTLKYKDYIIPKDDIICAVPPVSMRIDSVWENPNEFDPERFTREENKDRKYAFQAFGGGRHACLGERFAFLQIKTIWSHLLRTFDFELMGEFPQPDFDTTVVGPHVPCMVKFRRKKDPYSVTDLPVSTPYKPTNFSFGKF